ncbi:hypothetical protein CGMCC3_g5135 [Colletotrichum fructicola]|nr:uncharacterized protein CGMCC3_g5135 [Colletotrichum fructicola]KAE9578770.1 hypothetical protein CGMCC3_g5135 [Colletotrichum fructicola]
MEQREQQNEEPKLPRGGAADDDSWDWDWVCDCGSAVRLVGHLTQRRA